MFSFQTKLDFTLCGGVICLVVVVVPVSGLSVIFIPYQILSVIFGSLGALLFGCYLVFDTHCMLNGQHNYSISSEEYVFAALTLYLDLVNLFISVLSFIGGRIHEL